MENRRAPLAYFSACARSRPGWYTPTTVLFIFIFRRRDVMARFLFTVYTDLQLLIGGSDSLHTCDTFDVGS